MSSLRDYGAEIDSLTLQIKELKELLTQKAAVQPTSRQVLSSTAGSSENPQKERGSIFYSAQHPGSPSFRPDPQERTIEQLLALDSDKTAKVLAALGNKQRLDILKAVLHEPLTGPELVERLHMGTTGQLYHHTKALLGADLLVQEERGGRYSLPPRRSLPFLLLLAACSDLLDTSNYMELTEARDHAQAYLGASPGQYNPHYLLWSVIENSVIEHQSGYCTEINIILQDDRTVTVSDNGRGIPIKSLPGLDKPPVQAILTELGQQNSSASVVASHGLRGINMPVVNALSLQLSVEIRREGRIFSQLYKHGIPQSGLQVTGATGETGTSVTFVPDPDLFASPFDAGQIEAHAAKLTSSFPGLKVRMLS